MMKKSILTTILFTLTFNLFSQNFDDLNFGTDSTLEIMTWNLEWFPTNGQTTLDYVSEIIQALDVDVIAVQEIDEYNDFVQMMDALDGWEGIATNSGYLNLGFIYNTARVEMAEIYQIYPSKNRELPRKPLVMEIIFDGTKYILINNHLKCCGDGYMDLSDSWDEETRRFDACNLLDEYITSNFPDDNVILLGDLNDLLTDSEANNVFQSFIDKTDQYFFTDMEIAQGSSSDWSYPTWPSHLDHIMISNELFDEFAKESTEILTLKIEDHLENGFYEYEQNISDHRPVALKFEPTPGSAGIESSALDQLNIQCYPNPSKGSSTISFDPVNEKTKLKIFNNTGMVVQEIGLSKGQESIVWDALDFPNGIYHLRIQGTRNTILQGKIALIR